MWTDPDDLLLGDKHLLEEDFDMLGKASALDQQLWVAEMEASMSAKNHKNPKQMNTNADETQNPRDNDESITTEPLDLTDELGSEGSGVWQRRHWR